MSNLTKIANPSYLRKSFVKICLTYELVSMGNNNDGWRLQELHRNISTRLRIGQCMVMILKNVPAGCCNCL